ncbi:MAG: serine/threonine protein kinase [Planctomycetes bacterium]|nr:serine/threonine protein kinase [Planctomycetota bacterium]
MRVMAHSGSQFDARVEELLLEFLRQRDAGEEVDFEAHCRAHPQYASRLRELFAAFEFASRLRTQFSATTVSKRRRVEHGHRIDSDVSLGGEPRAGADPSSALLDRLRTDGPRGTRYRLLGELGRGGMGVVLKVWDDELRRSLAMKVISGESGNSTAHTPDVDPKTLGRFLEEAQITGQLDHPGIVPVHELGLDTSGRVYFTMKLVKGEDLRKIFEHVKTGHNGWNQVRALGVLLRVCEAMSFAHSKRVLHRDLKPANVMVGSFGEVYVMDWGLARVLGSEDRRDVRPRLKSATAPSEVLTVRRDSTEGTPGSPLMTMDGTVIGTPSYMPLEQARGELASLGPHSDVYSIGAMLYQLVSGEMPYAPGGTRVSQNAILLTVLREPPAPIERLAPSAPPELVAICDKAMQREISQRYATTEALALDLRAYLEGRVVGAYEKGAWARARKWIRRNRATTLALFMAPLLVVGWVVADTARRTARVERQRHIAVNESAAELAYRSGRWTEVVARTEQLAEFGAPASPHVQVLAARSLFALGRIDDSSRMIEELSSQSLDRAVRAKVMLLRADLTLGTWSTTGDVRFVENSQAALTDAIALGLDPDDQLYASGLRAESTPSALVQFQSALSQNPAHYSAHAAILVSLFFLGRFDEVRVRAKAYRTLFPRDPSPDLLLGMISALERDDHGVDEACAAVAEFGSGDLSAELRRVCDVCTAQRERLPALLESPFEVLDLRLLGDGMAIARGLRLANTLDTHRDVAVTRVYLPPIDQAWLALTRAFIAARISPGLALKPLRESLALHPEGMTHFYLGICSMPRENAGSVDDQRHQLAEAREHLTRAANSFSIYPNVDRAARYWRLRVEQRLAALGGFEENVDQTRSELHRALALEDPTTAELALFIREALNAGEQELALVLARRLRALAPDSFDGAALQVEALLALGAPAAARVALDEFVPKPADVSRYGELRSRVESVSRK